MKLCFVLLMILGHQSFFAQFKIYEDDTDRLPIPGFSIKNPDSVQIIKRYTTYGSIINFLNLIDLKDIKAPKKGEQFDMEYIFEEGKLKKIRNWTEVRRGDQINIMNQISNIIDFQYDKNQIISITKHMGIKKLIYKWEFEDGQLIKEIKYIEPGSKVHYEWLQEYQNKKLIKCTKKNNRGRIIYQLVNEYDSIGEMKSYKEYKKGKLVFYKEYNSFLTDEKVINFLKPLKNRNNLFQLKFKKDTIINCDTGAIVYMQQDTFGTFRISYDNHKNITDYKLYDQKGKLFEHYLLEYDKDDHLIKGDGYNYNTKSFSIVYSYNSIGLMEKNLIYSFGLLGEKLVYREINFYDLKGNIIRTEISDLLTELRYCHDYKYEKQE